MDRRTPFPEATRLQITPEASGKIQGNNALMFAPPRQAAGGALLR